MDFRSPGFLARIARGIERVANLRNFADLGTFDEAFYLRENLDVREAVMQGRFSSGLAHYRAFGRWEGRPAAPRIVNLEKDVVDRLYREILLRPADAVGALSSGVTDIDAIRTGLYASSEYKDVIQPICTETSSAFRLLFDREPTHEELTEYVQHFRGSCATDDEAIAVIKAGDVSPRLGLRPIGVELDITNQCNIRCVMCYFSDPGISRRPRRDLDDNIYARWADEMFPWLRSLGLMFGTEPTLHPRLVDYVRVAKTRRVPKVYFSTNGVKLTAQLSESLIDAGLDALNVSMDAGTKETFERVRRGAKWNNVIGNLRSLRDQKAARGTDRPLLGLSFVLMRSTLHEVPIFVELAAELGAEAVTLLHMVPYDNLGNVGESLVHELERCEEVLETASRLASSLGLQIRRPAPIRTSAKSTDFESTPDRLDLSRARDAFDLAPDSDGDARTCCPFPWYFLAIDQDGSVFPCGWWLAGPPMGNLYKQSFAEVWQGEPMRTLRGNLMRGELGTNCRRCPAAGMGSVQRPESFESRSPGVPSE